MSGNTIGKLFCVTTFGESHGPAIGCVIDGCPPGMPLSEADIQPELDRRKPGTSRHVTQRKESDTVEILSGVYEGKTTGTPIALLIRNEDQRSQDYGNIVDRFRPGHADFTYWHKYGIRDPRGGGRSSARLTAPVVGAAAVARKWLHQQYGTTFRGCMSQLGEVAIPFQSWDHVHDNPFFAANAEIIPRLESYMDDLRMASAMGVARMPTQGSWRPKVSTMTGWPSRSIERRGVRMLEVGLMAIDTVRSCPEEIPPKTPPALLPTNPSGVISSPCSVPFCATERKPAPISTPLTALMPIIA